MSENRFAGWRSGLLASLDQETVPVLSFGLVRLHLAAKISNDFIQAVDRSRQSEPLYYTHEARKNDPDEKREED